jgi:hypothetical protein
MKYNQLREIIRELIKSEIEETSTSGGVPGPLTPRAFKGKKGENKALPVHRYLSEASYRKFKGKVSESTTNQKIRRALKEMRNSVKTMNHLVDFSNKLKEEMGTDGTNWSIVKEQISIMSSQLNEIQKKLKTLYK